VASHHGCGANSTSATQRHWALFVEHVECGVDDSFHLDAIQTIRNVAAASRRWQPHAAARAAGEIDSKCLMSTPTRSVARGIGWPEERHDWCADGGR
jgi:hypothetical protein